MKEYQLLREKGNVIHDLTEPTMTKSLYGKVHTEPYHFVNLITDRYYGKAFYPIPFWYGDLILLKMESGKIGVVEVRTCELVSTSISKEKDDYYKWSGIHCGYLNTETEAIEIFRGYGFEKSTGSMIADFVVGRRLINLLKKLFRKE